MPARLCQTFGGLSPMPRKCTVCHHPDREKIDAALVERRPVLEPALLELPLPPDTHGTAASAAAEVGARSHYPKVRVSRWSRLHARCVTVSIR